MIKNSLENLTTMYAERKKYSKIRVKSFILYSARLDNYHQWHFNSNFVIVTSVQTFCFYSYRLTFLAFWSLFFFVTPSLIHDFSIPVPCKEKTKQKNCTKKKSFVKHVYISMLQNFFAFSLISFFFFSCTQRAIHVFSRFVSIFHHKLKKCFFFSARNFVYLYR